MFKYMFIPPRNLIKIFGAVLTLLLLYVIYLTFISFKLPKIETKTLSDNSEVSIFVYEGEVQTATELIPKHSLPKYIVFATRASLDFDDSYLLIKLVLKITDQYYPKVIDRQSLTFHYNQYLAKWYLRSRFSIDERLELYVNEMSYGTNTKGIGDAAKYYFEKEVGDLSLAESVVLASIPQAPSYYIPTENKKDENGVLYWRVRAEYVLKSMLEKGYIDDNEYTQAIEELNIMIFNQ